MTYVMKPLSVTPTACLQPVGVDDHQPLQEQPSATKPSFSARQDGEHEELEQHAISDCSQAREFSYGETDDRGAVGERFCDAGYGTSPVTLQSMRGPAEGLHEKLWRADLQDRVSDVHEIVQKVNYSSGSV
jgi:hypothetical protein